MTAETRSTKRCTGPWAFVCAGCDLLADAKRRDQTTCSATCRVRARRNGNLDLLRRLAREGGATDPDTGKPDVARILHAAALDRLRPDLAQQIRDGRLTIAQAMPAVVRELWRVAEEIATAESAAATDSHTGGHP